MNGPNEERSLVVIALDASAPSDFAIGLAGSLAGTAAPELLGLYIENTLLLEHAASRQAREILLTGAERMLDRHALERQLRSQAERARVRFAAASARLGLQHRFEIARGDVFAEPIRRAAGARALVLGLGPVRSMASAPPARLLQQMLETELPLVLLAREGWYPGRSVAVIVEALDTADAALDAAARIATQSGSPLTVLLAVGPDTTERALIRAVETALQERGIVRSNVLLLADTDVPGVERAGRACQAQLLVAPSPARPEEAQALGELLQRFPGALLLVRR